MMTLDVDGESTFIGDDELSVSVELDTELRCAVCGASEDASHECECPKCEWTGIDGDDAANCEKCEGTGTVPHDFRSPHWADSAGMRIDDDRIIFHVSVAGPRGSLTIEFCRADDGTVYMHTPYPGEPCPHVPVVMVHPGTYRLAV